MAFATTWIEKRALFPKLIQESPDPKTAIIVVVPAYDEPDIGTLLDSLTSCEQPPCRIEIIIIVNAPAGATQQSLENNLTCIESIRRWQIKNPGCFFRAYFYDAGIPPISGWGAGLARKTGMDEALRRLDFLGRPDGIIISLDADCRVDKNYFTEIYNELYLRKDHNACSIYFEHPVNGSEFAQEIYSSVTLYELHMRYYYQAVRYSGYPYAFHTIGSAFAFRAAAYIKAGGMGRKQAGEDFYFIQKLVPQGGYFTLNSTTVHPSPRRSHRVPFGTGPVISRMLDEDQGRLTTYDPAAFRELSCFFSEACKLFDAGESRIRNIYCGFPVPVRSFLSLNEWTDKIAEINTNTSSEESFKKRFFGWFNMFRIVKYLNHVHAGFFSRVPVTDAAVELLGDLGFETDSGDPGFLLNTFRELEKR